MVYTLNGFMAMAIRFAVKLEEQMEKCQKNLWYTLPEIISDVKNGKWVQAEVKAHSAKKIGTFPKEIETNLNELESYLADIYYCLMGKSYTGMI